ncbi:MAG: DNA-directed RNA polymerase subunit beta' [Chloroflexi bacterium]|nr:DNA-directed RNA polymerase subunit beta' [Chloroflexota bacterium]MQG54050.1 DNA-directed RNA polymerase subunit beta' [SAR202 cluster bacterium]
MVDRAETPGTNFNAIRISIASPEQILNWSHGEVTKPETINYRTLRPEKDGLFCERLFGPTKDWECFCGKYKRIRYRGVICDRCGVEVTRSKVRRERMGHIRLAAPVAHIWFSKTTPSRLGLLLDLSPRNLERVLYFAQHIIVAVDEDVRLEAIELEQAKFDLELKKARRQAEARTETLKERLGGAEATANEPVTEDSAEESGEEAAAAEDVVEETVAEVTEETGGVDEDAPVLLEEPQVEMDPVAIQAEIDAVADLLATEEGQLEEQLKAAIDELEDLRIHKLIAETRYRELKEAYGDVFEANMGAEAILAILKTTNLEALRDQLVNEVHSTSGQRRKKAIKRLRVVESFRNSGNRVEDMILSVLPVLPPELRPMVQLDGGRFATSDLNDLYRRVINRNNRLKRLMSLGAPEIIIRNEKRMLQEAVDALIDNGRRGRPIQGSHNHKLKSLSDLLRGKQGRFRQNLLGKRVDYSGRSVIVVGPELKMDECGLPKRMALELFKPFVMHRLVILGIAPNIKNAKRMVERARGEVWDILEDVIKDRPVLINRAPTLHRLGIQAFMPVLIEGNAIQIHPLVCSAFNADFDGDQMAVHVPLSRMAVLEAKEIMLSTHNMLSPASGDPLVAPTLDMVMGCYYLTEIRENTAGAGSKFNDFDEASIAYASDLIDLHAPIHVREVRNYVGEWVETTLGRMIFNEILPAKIGFQNILMDRGTLKDLTADLYRTLTNEETAEVLDGVKDLGFHYATTSGITIAINDIQVSAKKPQVLEETTELVNLFEDQFLSGLISDEERYEKSVDAWTKASDRTTEFVEEELPNYGGIAVMAVSGAKGNISQIKQMAGMRGLMSNPKGRIIDLPIKSSFREGLTALEYFISTHGARKGLADTALRTADSGYLTRRLIDIAQEMIILEEDCGTIDSYWVVPRPEDETGKTLPERINGRLAAALVAHPETGEILIDRNQIFNLEIGQALVDAGIREVAVRSPLICECQRGVCQSCYGRLPATGLFVEMGQAVGIIAAQSIGEPGTQLTMRTFHTGGIAGLDITSGLPRVEELFEARVPKGAAILADIDGVIEMESDEEGRRLRITSKEEFREDYQAPENGLILVDEGETVEPGMVLATSMPALKNKKSKAAIKKAAEDAIEAAQSGEGEAIEQVVANIGGRVEIDGDVISIVWDDVEVREHLILASSYMLVKDGDNVMAGEPLISGPLNPHDILHIRGKDDLQSYLVDQVQQVYQSQGVAIHDKHIEIILRQMLRRVQVESTGDSDFIPGQMVDKFQFQDQNAKVLAEGGEPTTAKPILLGITRASLLTDSFLSAASFQETTRVLTQAAVSGAQDWLQGLKENVIIGRLIPARVEIPGMEELLKPQPVPEIAAVSLEGWLGASDGEEAAPSGALDQLVDEDDVPAEPNIFTDGNDGAGEEAAANTDSPEMAVEEEEDDTPVDAPDDELDAEEEEDEDLDVAETGELSTNGTSPAFGEEDAEGNDEPTVATDNEGDE